MQHLVIPANSQGDTAAENNRCQVGRGLAANRRLPGFVNPILRTTQSHKFHERSIEATNLDCPSPFRSDQMGEIPYHPVAGDSDSSEGL